MEATSETVQVSRAALEAIEARAVKVNGALLRMRLAVERGDLEAVANCRALAQELNWTNRRALLDLGAGDSILQAAGLTAYTPDDEDMIDADRLDLGELREEFGDGQSPNQGK